MTNKHLEDAKTWFESGVKSFEKNNRVAVAQFTHSMIKALDALFQEKIGEIPSRHDKSIEYFKELLKKNLIKKEESKYKRTIRDILQEKNDADYYGKYFSKSDADKRRKQVKRIIEMVEKYVD